MDQLSERACYINCIERSKTYEKSKMDGDQSVSPVLSRSKKYYRPVKRDSRVSLEKRRFTSSPVPDENIALNSKQPAAPRVEIAQTSPGKSIPESNITSSKFKSDILSKIYEGFKTATGKNLSVSESKIRHQATKIFGDILNSTPAPMDQNLLNKSDSAAKRSFLTKVIVVENSNLSATLESKVACGDRASSSNVNLQDFSVDIKTAANDLSLTSEELSKCFEADIFSQLPAKNFCRINKATEVYSNTNYNEQSTESDSVVSDNKITAKKPFDINEISESELIYLADTAEYLSAQKSQPHSPKKLIKSEEIAKNLEAPLKDAKNKSPKTNKSRHHLTKSHHKRAKIKDASSKDIVDPIVSPSCLDQDPSLAKNIYELHRNAKFTIESEHQVVEKQKPPANTILANLMNMFGVKTSRAGISQEELQISREVFDRHSKVLEAVVHTMQVEEQLHQKKHLKKAKHYAKLKSQKSSQRDKDSAKRKVEDSPVQPKEEHALITQESKRSKLAEKKNSDGFVGTSIIKVAEKSTEKAAKRLFEALPEEPICTEDITNLNPCNPLLPSNKKLQIEIDSNSIKININSSGLNEPQIGFKSASGRDIKITPKAMEAAKIMYKSVEREVEMVATIPEELIKPSNYCGFEDCPSETDSLSTVNDYLKQTINDYNLNEKDAKDLVKFKGAAEPVVLGFSSASGNKINVSAKSMQIAQAMYQEAIDNDKEIKFDLLNSPDREGIDNNKVAVMFSVVSDGNCVKAHSFSTAAGVNEDKIKSANRLFDDVDMESFNKNLAGGKGLKVSEDSLKGATKLRVFESKLKTILDSDTSMKSAQELIGDAVSSMDTALNKLSAAKPKILKSSASKKRLGMTSAKCKPITISKHSLAKAKSFFDDTEDLRDIDPDAGAASSNISYFGNITNARSYQNSNAKSSRLPSPIKLSNVTIGGTKNSSPTRFRRLTCSEKGASPTRLNSLKSESVASRNSSPLRVVVNVSTPSKEGQQDLSFHNLNMSPIKPNSRPRSVNNRAHHNLSTIQESPSVLLMEQSSSDLTQIKADFDEECELLKKKLNILNDRKSALDLQESIMSTSTEDYKKPRPGILYLLKQRSNRVPLKDLQLCAEENVEFFNVDATILNFDFSLAEQVHFNTAMENGATVKTKDGAIIVPSANDSIGLTEIIRGFRTMPGIDPDLIPKGWIVNHFKMIVWKLASYERIFPHYFKNSLCLENVVQQLKYRYDREIDRAERPALRKITEKDDAPQKRMVLCVANIHEVSKHSFELDLSDGWYLIRTTIDQPLSQQVLTEKIRPGTKLMIQNAELLNCEDGCHPLQLPNHVRLRINLNSTRRSSWHSKLGYQKQARPLPIRISTAHPAGGQITQVKVYINRVYPIRYLEHDNAVQVWRNLKAEQKRAQEFDRAKASRVEKIQEKVMRDYANQKTKVSHVKVSSAELATITCSEQLHDLLECSNDPESFVERLSASQRTDLMAHMQNNNLRRQEEVLAKVAQEVNAQTAMERNVTGVLRLLVTDALDNSTDGVVLSIWRPTEDLLDSLVEDCVVSVFNVVPNKVRNELSSTSRTYFKVEERDCQKNNRQIVPIAMTIDAYYKPVFNEMDTIGLVVQTQVDKDRQELWICDFQGRLLLVQVHDGPKYCCLLDNVNRGECVAVLNVIVRKPHKGYGQCVANQLSVVSTYPQIKCLRETLEMFRQRLSKDVRQLLNDCDIKIEKYRLSAELGIKQDNFLSSKMVAHTSFDDYVDEYAFNSSGLTAADMALSILQIDPE